MGWASYNDGLVQCGLWRLQPTRFDSSSLRYVQFEKRLIELIDVVKPEMVFYEKVHRHLGIVAAHTYGGFLATLTSTCAKRDIPYVGLSVQQIKIHATTKGNAPKMAMIRMAQKKWPQFKIETDDVADALWCLDAGLDLYGK